LGGRKGRLNQEHQSAAYRARAAFLSNTFRKLGWERDNSGAKEAEICRHGLFLLVKKGAFKALLLQLLFRLARLEARCFKFT